MYENIFHILKFFHRFFYCNVQTLLDLCYFSRKHLLFAAIFRDR